MSAPYYTSARQREVWRMLPELFRARELFFDLIRKDLRVRYRYAAMGFFWAVLEPVALMLILTLVFAVLLSGKVAFAEVPGAPPYAVDLLCGLVFWQFLATSLTAASSSLVNSQNLVQKVQFPREIIPLAAVGQALINLLIGFAALLVIHLALGGALHFMLAALLPVFMIQFALVCGLALFASAAHVFYRDVGYIAGVAVAFGFYATPIFYRLEFVMDGGLPGWARMLYLANPMAGLITAYRDIFFLQQWPAWNLLLWPAALAFVLCAGGVWFFRRNAPIFSDYL